GGMRIWAGEWISEVGSSDLRDAGPRASRIQRTKRLLAQLQLNLADAEQRLDSEHGSLWDEHRAAPRLWHHEIAESVQRKCRGKQDRKSVVEGKRVEHGGRRE